MTAMNFSSIEMFQLLEEVLIIVKLLFFSFYFFFFSFWLIGIVALVSLEMSPLPTGLKPGEGSGSNIYL